MRTCDFFVYGGLTALHKTVQYWDGLCPVCVQMRIVENLNRRLEDYEESVEKICYKQTKERVYKKMDTLHSARREQLAPI